MSDDERRELERKLAADPNDAETAAELMTLDFRAQRYGTLRPEELLLRVLGFTDDPEKAMKAVRNDPLVKSVVDLVDERRRLAAAHRCDEILNYYVRHFSQIAMATPRTRHGDAVEPIRRMAHFLRDLRDWIKRGEQLEDVDFTARQGLEEARRRIGEIDARLVDPSFSPGGSPVEQQPGAGP